MTFIGSRRLNGFGLRFIGGLRERLASACRAVKANTETRMKAFLYGSKKRSL
jgi:hypothetical protein